MAKAIRNKFAKKVEFLSGFPFLANLTRITKEKLGLSIRDESYTLNQVVISEGDKLEYVYLIK